MLTSVLSTVHRTASGLLPPFVQHLPVTYGVLPPWLLCIILPGQ